MKLQVQKGSKGTLGSPSLLAKFLKLVIWATHILRSLHLHSAQQAWNGDGGGGEVDHAGEREREENEIDVHQTHTQVLVKQQTQLMLHVRKVAVCIMQKQYLDQTGGESNDPKWLS